MLPSGITVVFKLQKLTLLIFHPGIVQNLSFVTLKTHFSVENAIIFLVPLLHVLSGILQKNVNSNFASSSFLPLVSSDGTTPVLLSSKAELFAQTFDSNSPLDDYGAIHPHSTPSNSIMPKIRIFSKDVISALSELNTKKAYDPDGIPSVVLKTCASELAPCIGILFRLCLSTSTFPSC